MFVLLISSVRVKKANDMTRSLSFKNPFKKKRPVQFSKACLAHAELGTIHFTYDEGYSNNTLGKNDAI